MVSKRGVGIDLAEDLTAFGAGYFIQLGEYYWWAKANGQPAYYPGESLDGFVGYWSPLSSPWNLAGLLTGIALSLVPNPEGKTGRKLVRVAGKAIVGAEGWGYANHTLGTGTVRAFTTQGGVGADVGHSGPPDFIFSRVERQGPATANDPHIFGERAMGRVQRQGRATADDPYLF